MACGWRLSRQSILTCRVGAPSKYPWFNPTSPGTVYPVNPLCWPVHPESPAEYRSIVLSNDFLEVSILPEIGCLIASIDAADRNLLFLPGLLSPTFASNGEVRYPGGIRISPPADAVASGTLASGWTVAETEGNVTAWFDLGTYRGVHYTISIALDEDSTFLCVTTHAHNSGSEPAAAVFQSSSELISAPGANILTGDSDGVSWWTCLYDPRDDRGIVQMTGSARQMTPGSGVWREPVREGRESAAGDIVYTVVSEPAARTNEATIPPFDTLKWVERWTPIAGIGRCIAAAGPAALGLSDLPRDQAGMGIPGEEANHRHYFGAACEPESDEPLFIRAGVYAAEPVDEIELLIRSDSGVLLQNITLSTGDIWQSEALERGSECEVALTAGGRDLCRLRIARDDSGPASEAARERNAGWDTGSPENLTDSRAEPASVATEWDPEPGIRLRCRRIVLDSRAGLNPAAIEEMRKLVRDAPLDPVVRWLARRSLPHEGLEQAQNVADEGRWSPAMEPPAGRPAALNSEAAELLAAGVGLASLGLEEAAIPLGEAAGQGHALAAYHLAHCLAQRGDTAEADRWLRSAEEMNADFILPLNDDDLAALRSALTVRQSSRAPHYYLGIWDLAHGESESAQEHFLTALDGDSSWKHYAPLLRTLSICLQNEAAGLEGATASELREQASLLLDGAMERDPGEPTLLIERDDLAAIRGESAEDRLARMREAPAALRCSGVLLRTAALLIEIDDLDAAIRLFNTTSSEAWTYTAPEEAERIHAQGRLGRSLKRAASGDYPGALDDLEAALDFAAGRSESSSAGRAELLWWAGVCCHRTGRGFQARGYWQAAAAERKGGAPLDAICKALAAGSLGAAGARFELEAIGAGGAGRIESKGRIAFHSPEGDLAVDLALYITGEREAARRRIELMEFGWPPCRRAAWYAGVLAAGLFELF